MRFWHHIHSGYYDFLQRDIDVANLQSLSQSDVIDLFMTYIHPSSTKRAKLAVHIQSQVKPQTFSVEAAKALREEYTASFASAPQPPAEAWEMLSAGNSSVDTVKDFIRETFTAAGAPNEVLELAFAKVDELAARYPAASPKPSSDVATTDLVEVDEQIGRAHV